MAVTSEVVEIPVRGMTCDHCVNTVRRALEDVPGVESAQVDLEAERAEVRFDPDQTDPAQLRSAIEAAGYESSANGRPPSPPANLVTIGLAPDPKERDDPPAPHLEDWELSIGGMHCASCVGRVEGALSGVPGVGDARVNLATQRARLSIDPGRVSVDDLSAAVARAGYSAKRTEEDPSQGANALRQERAEQVAFWRRRVIVGTVLTIPLVILGYGPMVAPSVFGHAAWIGWAMLVLATPLLVYLGGPYLQGAWARLKQGSSNM
ncbi:MAG: copper ion binding protein, partial [Isosphaeraceae bacterium]